ncbi:unnamed protein product, partial [Rotaria sordida]
QYSQNAKCDDQLVNMHMLECYQKNIDQNIDITSPENDYFIDGNLLCQAYNKSSSYRKCLYSIFARHNVCSFERFPYSEFLRSLKCLERHEMELIPSTYGSVCSRNKGYYYYYGDVAARLQLAINICEFNLTF